MPQSDAARKTQLLEFIIRVLGDHEKQMDRIANKLELTKANLSASTQKLNEKLDKFAHQLDNIQAQVELLKNSARA